MKLRHSISVVGLLVLGLVLSGLGWADESTRISPLTNMDLQYMNSQRTSVDELARSHLGTQINGDTRHDLDLLQRLLDQGLVGPDQTQALQAMGIVLGDLLAADLDMDWVIYEDKLGRSRALRYRQTEEYLFPATMISRRREADNRRPVAEIYQKAYDIIEAAKPKLPFQ